MDERHSSATEFAGPAGDARLTAETAAAIVASLDLDVTRATIARAAVDSGCDCSAIYEVDTAGEVRRVALATREPRNDPLIRMLHGPRLDRNSARAVRRVLLTGEVLRVQGVAGSTGEASRAVWDAPLFRTLPVRSAILLPVGAAGTQAAIGLYHAGAERGWDDADIERCRDLASWSAVALEHARAHHGVQRVNARLERLLAVLSHDVGNPLTALRIAVSMMIRGATDARTDDQSQYLDHMNTSIDQLKRLIEEVRDLRRLEAGKMTLLFEHDAPATLLGHLVEQQAAHSEARGITISTSTRGPIPQVRLDRRRTLQALAILVERAVAVTAAGGTVTIAMHSDADDVIISVSDEGMLPEGTDHGNMLDQFWTDPLERGGHETPLRLALARGMVECQGGRCWAAPRDRGGTTICCALPHAPHEDLRTPE